MGHSVDNTVKAGMADNVFYQAGRVAGDISALGWFYYVHVCMKTIRRLFESLIESELTIKGEHLGEFEELILLAVRQLRDEAHSSSIQALLVRSAKRAVTLGAVYAALDRCQRKGLADSKLSETTGPRGGRPRRHYSLTPDGDVALMESRRIREGLWRDAAQGHAG